MENIKQKWLEALGTPKKMASYGKAELIGSYSHKEFDAEIYMQENSAGKHQRVLMIFPKEILMRERKMVNATLRKSRHGKRSQQPW